MASEYGCMNFLDEITVQDAWSERIWVHMSGTEGWQWGQAPIVYKMPLMACVSNSLWQLSPARSLLVWLRHKPGGTATTDRRRGEDRLPGAWKPVLWVDGAHQSGKTVHLREGKLWFQTSAALRPYPLMGKASGVNPEEKSGAGVPKVVQGCIQQCSGNSCNGTGTMCIGACLSNGPFQWRGEVGSAAWVTAFPPYLLTQALRSGEVTPASLCSVDKTREVAVYRL